jgi:carbonic anhydrase
MALTAKLLPSNVGYASAPHFDKVELALAPARKVAIVVCMDARIDPAQALGLEEGAAHVIRNAGGRVSDALRSLMISQTLLGTEEVVIVHHSDCGMVTLTAESTRMRLCRDRSVDADSVAILPFANLDASVLDDLEAYRASPLVRQDIPLRGFAYDVSSGRLREVHEKR